ncbi:quinone oxidoreductase family protein [Parafrankia elaeagni]|uniref:quinone oxidoreductase family protein n=1 Tax=Parafrankia elaeagni TaxID=222534 RepID=UPI0003673D27|nr:zinc-binding alcohol dehydrogenase family protein [Parafrankia elaeagni]
MIARSVRVFAPGAPPRVDEVTLPEPGDSEVLVSLSYAAVNPLDTYAAAGQVGDTRRLPRTLGIEGSGYLDGHPVVVQGAGLGMLRDGTWAEAVVVPRACVYPVPEGVDLAAAAGVPVAGVTALRIVQTVAQVDSSDRVLVLGAAGGVGSIAVQFAKLTGAAVYAQVGSEAKRDAAAELGADGVLVSDAAGLVATVADLRPTVVLDPLGGDFLAAAVELTAVSGRIVSYGVSAGPQTAFSARTFYRNALRLLGYAGMRAAPARAAEGITAVLTAIADGHIRVPVGHVVPLTEIETALTLLRGRAAIGKIILDVRS